MIRLASALVVLAAIVGKGEAYLSDDLKIPSPGPGWQLQDAVGNAPQLRGAFTLDHGKTSSIITFALDRKPEVGEAMAYLEKGFGTLSQPPLSFHVIKKEADTFKGVPAARAEYTDADGKRHFAQLVAKFPEGMLVMVIQAPDADVFKDDFPAFQHATSGVAVGSRKSK
ncbi:MAG TPA: hypothetical protein VMV18_09515 [bacterium]|nr:hypothetical protein [bacterium]